MAIDAANLGAGNLALGLVAVGFLVTFATLTSLVVYAIRSLISGASKRGETEREVWINQLDKLSTSHEKVVETITQTHRDDIKQITNGMESLTNGLKSLQLEVKGISAKLEGE
jgi:hypothetical protein